MTILSDIKDGIERARRGELSLYWQRDMEREYRSIKPTAAEKRAYTELKNVLQAVPQWSDEAELMKRRLRFAPLRVWGPMLWA